MNTVKSKKIANPEYKELETSLALVTKTRDAKKAIVAKVKTKVNATEKETLKLSKQWETSQEKLAVLVEQFRSIVDEFGSTNDECRELIERLKSTPKYIEER